MEEPQTLPPSPLILDGETSRRLRLYAVQTDQGPQAILETALAEYLDRAEGRLAREVGVRIRPLDEATTVAAFGDPLMPRVARFSPPMSSSEPRRGSLTTETWQPAPSGSAGPGILHSAVPTPQRSRPRPVIEAEVASIGGGAARITLACPQRSAGDGRARARRRPRREAAAPRAAAPARVGSGR